MVDAPRRVPHEAWHGLSVFVVPERSAMQLTEAVSGIARGIYKEGDVVVGLQARNPAP